MLLAAAPLIFYVHLCSETADNNLPADSFSLSICMLTNCRPPVQRMAGAYRGPAISSVSRVGVLGVMGIREERDPPSGSHPNRGRML